MTSSPRLSVLVVLLACSACSTEQVSRGIYEGGRAYDKSIQGTPLERSKSELPTYDQYEKERRSGDSR